MLAFFFVVFSWFVQDAVTQCANPTSCYVAGNDPSTGFSRVYFDYPTCVSTPITWTVWHYDDFGNSVPYTQYVAGYSTGYPDSPQAGNTYYFEYDYMLPPIDNYDTQTYCQVGSFPNGCGAYIKGSNSGSGTVYCGNNYVYTPPTKQPTAATPSPIPAPTRSPQPYPTRAPVTPSPTISPTNGILSYTTQTPTTESYTSTGTSYQEQRVECNRANCQVTCESAENACNGLVIDASIATTLILYCRSSVYKWGCRNVNIINPPSTSAYMWCTGSSACSYAEFELTELTTAAIYCKGIGDTIGGCFDTDFYLNNTQTVTAECQDISGCKSANFYLDGVNTFNIDTSYADGIGDTVIVATNMDPSGSIQIDCGAASACDHIYLWCPLDITCNINCVVSASCTSANIFIPHVGYEYLGLACSGSSCDSIYFRSADSMEPGSGYLLLGGLYAQIYYNSTFGKYVCWDDEDDGCCPKDYKYGANLDYTSSGTSVTVNCNTGVNCESVIIDLTAQEYALVSCTKDYACRSVVILAPRAGTSPELDLHCIGAHSCEYAYIDAKFTKTTQTICEGENSCFRQAIYYPDQNYASSVSLSGIHYCRDGIRTCQYSHYSGNGVSMQMNCKTTGSNVASYSSEGSCYYVYGVFIDSVLTSDCSTSWSCYRTFWTISGTTSASWNCGSTESCYSMYIYGYDAQQVDVECIGSNSCYGNKVQCPSIEEYSCHYNCNNNNACIWSDFYIQQNWILQWLQLECNTAYTSSCNGIQFNCPYNIGNPTADIEYNSLSIGCIGGNYIDCCPFGTYNPTKSPSNKPTINPTIIPTDNTNSPSISPTNVTNIPTVNPTNTTKEPTNEPTESIVHGESTQNNIATETPTKSPQSGSNDGNTNDSKVFSIIVLIVVTFISGLFL